MELTNYSQKMYIKIKKRSKRWEEGYIRSLGSTYTHYLYIK